MSRTLTDLMAHVESTVRHAISPELGFLRHAFCTQIAGSGSRLHSTLTLLSAECAGGATHDSVVMASALEIIHLALLIHGGVEKDGISRDTWFPGKGIRHNQMSVLLGDCFFAMASKLAAMNGTSRLVPDLESATAQVCRGQILALRAVGHTMSERQYVRMLRERGGDYLGVCARVGVQTAHGSDETAEALQSSGQWLGIALQFVEDLAASVSGDRCAGPKGDFRHRRKGIVRELVSSPRPPGGQDEEIAWHRLDDMLRCAEEQLTRLRESGQTGMPPRVAGQTQLRVRLWLDYARRSLQRVPDSPAKQVYLEILGGLFPALAMSGAVLHRLDIPGVSLVGRGPRPPEPVTR